MIGATKLRVALGLVLLASIGPAAVSDARPVAASTIGPARSVMRVEYVDNAAYLIYNQNGQNGAGSSVVFKPDDPLTFHVHGFPPVPGTNLALVRVELFNNTSGEIGFPGGLHVTVILRSSQRAQVARVSDPATSLAPGAGLRAETTVALRGFGQYSVSAFTVARYAMP